SQAAIAVLFVILYGYAAKAYNIISSPGLKNMSTITTSLFLPALFISEISPEAELSRLIKYWPIVVFPSLNIFISYIYASVGRRLFKSKFSFPLWIIPSCMFNNTITLMLLMLDNLGTLGAFDDIVGENNRSQAIRRAKAYFLLNALVHSLIKFSIAPKLMSTLAIPVEVTSTLIDPGSTEPDHLGNHNTEEMPLLSTSSLPRASYDNVWRKIRETVNPPLLGALLAFIIGVIPLLRHMFLEKGGIFTSTLTQSIQKMGNIYATIQLFVVGAQPTKKSLPKFALVYLLSYRFILMPIFSISVISALRHWQPDVLLKDPIFDFALMIAPVGPTTSTMAAVSQIANLSEDDTSLVASMLTISYIVSPLISVPIASAVTIIAKQSPIYSVMK
ncbi:hypothetical protein BU17DRAFT_51541, partial [Hysterangium stoloniferum]